MRLRVEDWPERLAALVAARMRTPFLWGTHDCCSFAADVAAELTGADPLAGYRGRYGCEAEAEALIGPGGLAPFVEALMAAFGAPPVEVAAAQRGDWALLTVGNMPMVGVVLGGTIAAPGMNGLAFVPARRAQRAWSI